MTDKYAILILAVLGLVTTTCDAAIRLVPTVFATIQEAEDASKAGDTIKILPGEYREHVQVDVPSLRIAGMCQRPEAVVVDGGKDSGNIFEIRAADVAIECLVTRHGSTAVHADPGTGLAVSKVTVLHPYQDGIRIVAGDDFHILDTEIQGSGFRGLVVEGSGGSGPGWIESTSVSHSGDACFHLENVHGIVLGSSSARQCEDSYGLFLTGNDNKITDSLFSYAEYGLYLEGSYNEATNNELIGSGFSDNALLIIGDDNSIRDNRVTNTYFTGIAITGNRNRVVGNQIDNAFNDSCIDYEGDEAKITGNTCGHAFYGISVVGNDARLLANRVEIVGFDAFYVAGDNPVLIDNSVITGGGYNAFEVNCTTDCSRGELRGNHAEGVGDDYSGFFITGMTDGLQVSGNQASHTAEFGFEILCNGCVISGNHAQANGSEDEAGFFIQGYGNSITHNRSSDNAGAGYWLLGDYNAMLGNTAQGNLLEGFFLAAGFGNLLETNHSENNRAEGIDNRGVSTLLLGNHAADNRTDCTNDATIAVDDLNVCADGSNFTVPSEVGN